MDVETRLDDGYCSSAEGAAAMSEFSTVVSGAAVLAPEAGRCLVNAAVGELLEF